MKRRLKLIVPIVSLIVIWGWIVPETHAQEANQVARARIKEAGSATRLTAEGEELYRADNQQMSWGQYCSTSWRDIEQGRLREAIRNASKALYLGSASGNDHAMAFAKRDLSLAYSYAGDLQRAIQLADQAIKHTSNSAPTWNKDSVLMVVHKVRADVLTKRQEYPEAIKEYQIALNRSSGDWAFFVRVSLANAYVAGKYFDEARKLFADIGMPSDISRKQLVLRGLGGLALAVNQSADALRYFQDALKAASADEYAYDRVWALEGVARSHLLAGNKDAALQSYLEAALNAEKVRARFRSEEFKSGLFGEMRMIFDGAVRLLAESGQAETAWEMSERGRGRALLDMLRQRVKLSAGGAALSESFSSSVKLAEVRAGLADGQVLIQYHVLPDVTFAWTIRNSGILQTRIDLKREDLVRKVEFYRDLISARQGSLSAQAGGELYQKLVAPMGLREKEQLIIVPHDALHYLPFQALNLSGQFLIEMHSVSYAPSASALITIFKRPLVSVPRGVLALGNPDLNDPELALPGAQREVELIGKLYPDASVFIGKAATKQQMVKGAASSRIMHVAAHAQVDSVDPLFSRIRLASNATNTGDLEAHEVYRLDLTNTETIVLSACDSGLGRVSNGDEIWGFTRAFLGAGASTLVVSLWPVADESTERLMSSFYSERVKGVNRHSALRDAQLSLLKVEEFRDPFFWAPFNLIGDWR